MTTTLARKLFTVKEYDRLIEAGILADTPRLELIRGEIVKMAAIGRKHAGCVNRLNDLMHQKLGQSVILAVQNPVAMDELSEPQPDLTILRRQADFYTSGHPQPDDVLLLIEVADSTLESDRAIKIPLYAEAAITEVWLVNLNDDQVEVYRHPIPTGYQSKQVWQRGQTLTMLAFPMIPIAVDEILG